MNIIESLIDTNKSEGNSERLLEITRRIRDSFEKKKNLRKDFNEIKSKLLIENQIVEEFKRKMEENAEYYGEQIQEQEENLENKNEYIKIFEKKLKEVEIYIQKNTKNLVNSKYEAYKNFKMNDFIDLNTKMTKTKEEKTKEIFSLKSEIRELQNENKKYEEEIEYLQTFEENNCNINPKLLIHKEKFKKYFDQYRIKIKTEEIRKGFLKNLLKALPSILNTYKSKNSLTV